MEIGDIRKVLIVGAGTMGCQIGLQCAMHGYRVAVYAPGDKELAEGRRLTDGFAVIAANCGYRSREEIAEAQARMEYSCDAAAAARDADIVSESIPEDPVLKGEVFGMFDKLCPERTVFTTNTSSLVPSQYAAATGRPERFAALHFHNYVWISNVTDVMPHPGTDPAVAALIEQFARSIGQVPLRYQKESHGYIYNALLGAINREAIGLVARGVATPEDVDRSWMGISKSVIGPFGIMDKVGLETVWKITRYRADTLNDPTLDHNANFIRSYIDEGRLGAKNGRGFYSYPDPAYARPGFVEGK